MSYRRILLFTWIIVLIPSFVWASGGGPLLLLFNGSVFVVGQIWIIGIEFLIYRRKVISQSQEAFWDILTVNIFSTICIAFGMPMFIAAVGLAGNFLPGPFGELVPAIGTWVFENGSYSKLAIYMALFWFVLLFVITIFFEAWIFKRRWAKRSFVSNINPIRLSFYTNALSHVGLFIAVLIIWHELF